MSDNEEALHFRCSWVLFYDNAFVAGCTDKPGKSSKLEKACQPAHSPFAAALHQSATPDHAFVYLVNPSDPTATYTVTVDTTPGGLSSLSQSSFQLRDGEFATFDVYPNAISQKRGDGTVRAFVAGRETGRVAFTNVGVVLPQDHIRGPDTTEGFQDRVSTGDSNWGTDFGIIQVYPNLYAFVIR